MANSTLSTDTLQSIQKILSLPPLPKDPLDNFSSQFDVLSSLNNIFLDESSLSASSFENAFAEMAQSRAQTIDSIRSFRSELGVNLLNNHLEEGISLSSDCSEPSEPSNAQISDIQEMISDLLLQTTRIREKSSESSHVVHEITKDMQHLDLTKRNLVTSINTLRRLSMLTTGIIRLEALISSLPRNYREIAQTLSASKNLATLFKSSMRIPLVAITLKRLQELQGELRSILDTEFNSFFLKDQSKSVKPSIISNACLVVDVLGEDVRNYLIDHYCTLELKEYRRIFRASDEAGHLDNISRRFAYFKRLLGTYDAEFSRVFPAEWKVGCALCAKWNEITRDDLSSALSRVSSKLTVVELLQALQETTEFQTLLSQSFKMPYFDILSRPGSALGEGKPKPMSAAFEPHMGIFVDAQDKTLSDLLMPHRGVKSRASLDGAPTTTPTVEDQSVSMTVLSSSTELFYFYAQNLEQCSQLSTKTMLVDMFGVWQKWLRIYAEDVLMVRLKRPDRERRSLETHMSVNEIYSYCLVLNTADYCQVTAIELEEKVKEKIDDDFKDRISLQAEKDLFVSIIFTAISNLLKELEAIVDGPLLSLQRMPWTALENVSGESRYVASLTQAVQDMVNVVQERVEQKKYLRIFFDKASILIITKFTNSLVKSRPLKERGAEQLLLDLHKIRSCLLKMPGNLATDGSSYSKSVVKHTSRLETLLKLVNAPVNSPEDFVRNYLLLVGDSSFSNFQKILDLKGTGRADQNDLLDIFLTMTSTRPELESTSFLSSLDMDPGSSSTTHMMSPSSSRANLPNLLGGGGVVRQEAGSTSSFGALGLGNPTSDAVSKGDGKKEPSRMSEFRRLVSLVRREASQ